MKLFNFATAYELQQCFCSVGYTSVAHWLTDCTCVKSGGNHICT